MLRVLLTVLLLIIALPGIGSPSDSYVEQLQTILDFYETLVNTKAPTVSDFLKLFGDGNEAELKLILRQKFPSLDLEGNWFENKTAADYVDRIFKKPQENKSVFLQCVKSKYPALAERANWQIEFPPEITKDFRRFSVISQKKKIIIEFSQAERTIENVYLPGGQSIYNLIENCAKTRKKEKN